MTEIKTLYIDADLHKRVKLAATLAGLTIREWVERALRANVPHQWRDRELVDPGVEYDVGADFGPGGESCPD